MTGFLLILTPVIFIDKIADSSGENENWMGVVKKIYCFFLLIILYKKDGMIYMGCIKYHLTLCKESHTNDRGILNSVYVKQ